MDKILIVGGDSFIGQALYKSWGNQKVLLDLTSRNKEKSKKLFFDLQDPDFSVFSSHYDFIVFLAGITNIKFCIDYPELSEQINVRNTIKALTFFETVSANILFISSADVFDGSKPRESIYGKQRPRNLYGQQKTLVEKFILKNLASTSILRLSKVVDRNFKLFTEWRDAISQGEIIFPYVDKYFSPTSIENVINKINFIRLDGKTKLNHCYGDDDISYYDYAINHLKLDKTLIIPSNDPAGAQRDFFSSLEDDS